MNVMTEKIAFEMVSPVYLLDKASQSCAYFFIFPRTSASHDSAG
jgi:hypothetical protein